MAGRKEQPTRSRTSRILALSMALSAVVGCSAAPPRSQPSSDLPGAAVIFLRGIVVDVDRDQMKFTAKDRDTYETWTVAVVEATQFRSPMGEVLRFEDLDVGGVIELRGRSRIAHLMTADEVIFEKPPSGTAPEGEGFLRRDIR